MEGTRITSGMIRASLQETLKGSEVARKQLHEVNNSSLKLVEDKIFLMFRKQQTLSYVAKNEWDFGGRVRTSIFFRIGSFCTPG